MKKKYMIISRWLFLVFSGTIFSILLLSCEKFDSSQEVPAYIKIDEIGVVTEYDIQGTSSHNITDAWLIVNGQLVGAYELPALIPVLDEGLCKVEIYAGIMQNGIAATRVPYPFYEPLVIKGLMLTPDSITVIDGNVRYYDNTVFAWMEDFEGNLRIAETSKSDTVIERISDPSEVFEGDFSGKIALTSTRNYYQGAMKEGVQLPRLNTPVYIEVNYKLENVTTFGLFSISIGAILEEPVLNINKSDIWKKIYINLTPIVNRNTSAIDFKIFIESALGLSLSDADMYLDNIKLVHR